MATQNEVNILIVDDRADKLMALETVIADLGHIVKAHSGKEALRQLLNGEFAVILLDVNMPGMDGFETASLIRQRESTAHVPIIFVTAYNETETHISRGYLLGAVDYILAPIIPEVLRAKVSVFVDLFKKTQLIKEQAEARIEFERAESARAAAEAAASRLRILSEAASQLLEKDPNEIIGDICERISRELGFEEYCCYLTAPDGVTLNLVASSPGYSCISNEKNPAFSLEEAMARVRLHQASAHVTCRMRSDNRLLGGLCFCSDKRPSVDDETYRLLQTVADQIGIALERKRLLVETQNRSQELAAANRAKDEFLAVVSHELRTPLTPILGWTRMLRRGGLAPKELVRAIEVIERNALTQTKLIEDLLDVSRIIAGKLTISTRPIQLITVIEAGLDAVRATAEAKGIRISTKLDPEASFVTGDPDRLQQVVWNIVSNAIKFTPNQGHISIQLERTGARARLSITDTGKGIPPEALPHVFERFWQADSATTRRFGGLGLGLAIVRHIVELHGGSVHVHSDGEGMGACFSVEIPLHVVNEGQLKKVTDTSRIAVEDANDSSRLSGTRILVIEDEPDSRELIAMVLRARGATVTEAACVEEALNCISRETPDMVVSDIAMPGADGYSFIRSLRGKGSNIPAIALTAYAKEDDRDKALAAGFQLHLSKPVDPANLVDVVVRLRCHVDNA